VLVAEAGTWGEFEEEMLRELGGRQIPTVIVFNKIDAGEPEAALVAKFAGQKIRVVKTSALRGTGMLDLRQALLDLAPPDFIDSPAIVSDLVGPDQLVVLVCRLTRRRPRAG